MISAFPVVGVRLRSTDNHARSAQPAQCRKHTWILERACCCCRGAGLNRFDDEDSRSGEQEPSRSKYFGGCVAQEPECCCCRCQLLQRQSSCVGVSVICCLLYFALPSRQTNKWCSSSPTLAWTAHTHTPNTCGTHASQSMREYEVNCKWGRGLAERSQITKSPKRITANRSQHTRTETHVLHGYLQTLRKGLKNRKFSVCILHHECRKVCMQPYSRDCMHLSPWPTLLT